VCSLRFYQFIFIFFHLEYSENTITHKHIMIQIDQMSTDDRRLFVSSIIEFLQSEATFFYYNFA